MDNKWRLGYVFDSGKPVDDVAELNENQTIIAEHPDSPFNKHSLITLHTEQERLTLTNASLTHWSDGTTAPTQSDSEPWRERLPSGFLESSPASRRALSLDAFCILLSSGKSPLASPHLWYGSA